MRKFNYVNMRKLAFVVIHMFLMSCTNLWMYSKFTWIANIIHNNNSYYIVANLFPWCYLG